MVWLELGLEKKGDQCRYYLPNAVGHTFLFSSQSHTHTTHSINKDVREADIVRTFMACIKVNPCYCGWKICKNVKVFLHPFLQFSEKFAELFYFFVIHNT